MCPQFLSHFQTQWEEYSVEKGNKTSKSKIYHQAENSSHNNTAERVEAYQVCLNIVSQDFHIPFSKVFFLNQPKPQSQESDDSYYKYINTWNSIELSDTGDILAIWFKFVTA
jgi:hypothetical protein